MRMGLMGTPSLFLKASSVVGRFVLLVDDNGERRGMRDGVGTTTLAQQQEALDRLVKKSFILVSCCVCRLIQECPKSGGKLTHHTFIVACRLASASSTTTTSSLLIITKQIDTIIIIII